jgi:hypothetical protein
VSSNIDELEVWNQVRVGERPGGFQVESSLHIPGTNDWAPRPRAAASTLSSTVLDSTALSGQGSTSSQFYNLSHFFAALFEF